jgi:NADPH:quinone reductase-like Zn-dependent oxidoreductase
MRAIVYHDYGTPEVLALQEVERPTAGRDEVLIKVQASSVNWHDWHFLTGTPALARIMAGFIKPKHRILGIDFSGYVEAVGENINNFYRGEEVFGTTSNGCFAEYVIANAGEVQHKPTNLTFAEAAAAGAAAFTALQGLRDHGQIEAGEKVLINGASGGVGTFAVQIAKAFGAEVVAVCSRNNCDLVREIGADLVIDYLHEDFTQQDLSFNLVFDIVANRTYAACEKILADGGIYVTTEFSPALVIKGQWVSLVNEKKLIPLLAKPPDEEDQAKLCELLKAGKIRSVIDRTYPLSDIPDALRYLSQGHARGKIVITI